MAQRLMRMHYIELSIREGLVEIIDIGNLASHVCDVLRLCMFCSSVHDFLRDVCGGYGALRHVFGERCREGSWSCSTIEEFEIGFLFGHCLKCWD